MGGGEDGESPVPCSVPMPYRLTLSALMGDSLPILRRASLARLAISRMAGDAFPILSNCKQALMTLCGSGPTHGLKIP